MAPTQVDSTKLAAPASSEGAASSSAGAAPDDESPDLPFDMFSMRKPKNLVRPPARSCWRPPSNSKRPRSLLQIAGASSGLKSALKGVVGGTVGLIAAPIVGAQTQGVGGFFTGLVTGILGAVALPVAGAAVGCLQERPSPLALHTRARGAGAGTAPPPRVRCPAPTGAPRCCR